MKTFLFVLSLILLFANNSFFPFQHVPCSQIITPSTNSTAVPVIDPQTHASYKQQALYNLFAAYIHAIRFIFDKNFLRSAGTK
jgi:hypothetical protein